jgi:hypothetical protein
MNALSTAAISVCISNELQLCLSEQQTYLQRTAAVAKSSPTASSVNQVLSKQFTITYQTNLQVPLLCSNPHDLV